MTWLRYVGGDYEPDVNIRLEDVIGVTVGNEHGGQHYTVTVFYSDGGKMYVGTFSPQDLNNGSMEGQELARERAEEILAAVDKVK